MKIFLFLILILAVTKAWAPPPEKNERAETSDISKCSLNPQVQTKVTLIGKDGKRQSICTGQAACGGKTIPVSCRVTDREPCPVAKKCIVFKMPNLDQFSYVAHKFDVSGNGKTDFDLKKIDSTSLSLIPTGLINPKITLPEAIQGLKILSSKSTNSKLSENIQTTIDPGKSYQIFENKPKYQPIGLFQAVTGAMIYKNCTGTLIKNPNLQGKTKWAVITSASCLYDRATETWVTNPSFVPNFPFYRGESLKLKFSVIPSEFLNPNNPYFQAFDYGLIAAAGEPPENCCLNLMILGTSSDSYSKAFPIFSNAIQIIRSRGEYSLFETKIIQFESPGTLDPNFFRLVKNDINLSDLGKGAPLIGKNPQSGEEGFVFGLNIGKVDGRPGILISPVLGKTFEKMWKCIEDELKECPEMAL